MGTKICCFCKEEKDVSQFHKDCTSSDGLKPRCKVCINKKKSVPKEGHKVCTSCEEEKSFSEFGPDKKGKFKLASQCGECRKAKSYNYWVENRKKMLNKSRETYWNNLELARKQATDRTRKYRLKGTPFNSWEEYKNYKKENSAYKNKCRIYRKNEKRTKEISQASYYFGDEEFFEFFMNEAYHLSKLREESLGIKHHVDHIVPLKAGKARKKEQKACGLHTPANIQVIPEKVNLSKGSLSWPDM